MTSDMNVRMVFWLFGIISTITLGIASFSLIWMFQTNADLQVLQAAVEGIAKNNEADERQNETLSRHWRLHGWSRDEINRIKQKVDMPLTSWPDLD